MVDGLKGFPEAITAVFPEAVVQTCIVHLLRNSMDFVSFKDRKAVATALKDIYRAIDAQAAEQALDAFEAGVWGQNTRRSARAGAGPGRKSSPSSPSQATSGGSSTRRMPSKRSIPSCAERFGREAISPAMRQSPSSCF